MDRPDEGRMHQLAVRAAPKAIVGLEGHIAKPKSRVVAVERHDYDWRDGRWQTEERFLWLKARDASILSPVFSPRASPLPPSALSIKARARDRETLPLTLWQKTTVQLVKDNYRKHYEVPGHAKLTFLVKTQVAEDSTPLSDLNKYHDQYVVFTTQSSNNNIPTAPKASSRLFGPELTATPSKSPPNKNSMNAKPKSSKSVAFALPNDVSPKDDGDLMNLPSVADNESLFMAELDTADTSDHHSGDNIGLSMEDFLTEEQKVHLAAGHHTDTTSAYISDFKPVQADEFGYEAPEVPTQTDEVPSSTFEYAPRPTTSYFGGVAATGDDTAPQTSLQLLLLESTPERLEAAVKQGVTVLSEVEDTLSNIPGDADAKAYLEQIEEVRKLAQRSRTVVGVVGNTGAGKSSVINAVLDEERLVPTNCMRACTAVVTEMSYNDSTSESARYRAEIEFIKPTDWEKELTMLFSEVSDQGTGISKDINNPDSIAGVAYAKIRAVYPKHTKDMLQKSTVRQLMDVPHVKSILGTTKRIVSGACDNFYQRLQHYVDSQQKFELDKHRNKSTNSKRELEFWPLIKVVRIYTKAKALATGAVIVDLPGVQDSNAARAAVAEGYMKECTGLWIVAPITRAVDDKAAKNLLGTTFKRQLKYDGTYSAVTFICSKTDDVSRTEAADALNLGDLLAELDAEHSTILREKRALKDEREDVRVEREAQNDTFEKYDQRLQDLEGFISKTERGQSIEAPESPERKRKLSTGDEEFVQPATVEEARIQIDEHKHLKKAVRQRGQELRDRLAQLNRRLIDLESRESQIDQQADALCIRGRNDWSRRHIREDFAEGIKELDQENAAEEDPDNFDPEDEIRDYEEVARSLPVFCVSSRAYQKLSGRLQKDSNVGGFISPDQTEIPQLQAHCRKLTESGRQAGCKRFLSRLNQLLTSLALWAVDDGSSLQMTNHQRLTLKQFISTNLQTLQQALKTAADQTMEDAGDTLEAQLFGHFAKAGRAAAKDAVKTATGWGAPRESGGLFWATYKATVRRHGNFQGASGSRNFNVDLTEPLYKELGTPWEKTFHRRLPSVLQGFPRLTSKILQEFHATIVDRCMEQGAGTARVARLGDNLPIYDNAFNDVAKTLVYYFNEAQREINREFTPYVTAAMRPAYEHCAAENGKKTPGNIMITRILIFTTGRGSFNRMKQHMHSHVSSSQAKMFDDATSEVKDKLNTVCDQVRTNMHGRVDRMFQAISRDYMTIVGTQPDKGRAMGKPGKTARKQVEGAIADGEAYFSEVLTCDLEQLDVAAFAEIDEDTDGQPDMDSEDASKPLVILSGDGVDGEELASEHADETGYGTESY